MPSILVLLFALMALPSCAAIVCKKTYQIPVDSVPQGAVVSYKGDNVGITPCTVQMHRRDSRLVLKHDGFHEQSVDVGTRMSGWVIGNVVFGGIIGLIVDLSGGAKMLVEGPCWVELTPSAERMPTVWTRPVKRAAPSDGWVPEGQEAVVVAPAVKEGPTRAPALPGGSATQQPVRASTSDGDGWVRHGTGH